MAQKNWKTTASGIASLVLVGLTIWQKPETLSDPTQFTAISTAIATGIGLILASDAKPKQPTAPPTTPEDLDATLAELERLKQQVAARKAAE